MKGHLHMHSQRSWQSPDSTSHRKAGTTSPHIKHLAGEHIMRNFKESIPFLNRPLLASALETSLATEIRSRDGWANRNCCEKSREGGRVVV